MKVEVGHTLIIIGTSAQAKQTMTDARRLKRFLLSTTAKMVLTTANFGLILSKKPNL